jgi:hypothetical protein
MQRIIIDHFGPIKHLDLPIKDLTILIGPNASGKSLVGKLLWFFKGLPDQLFWYVHDGRWKGHSLESFWSELTERAWPSAFRDAFGSREYLRPDTRIVIEFSSEKFLEFSGGEDYLISLKKTSEALTESLALFGQTDRTAWQRYNGDELWDKVNQVFGQPEIGRQFRWYFATGRGSRKLLEKSLWSGMTQVLEGPSPHQANSQDNATYWSKAYLGKHRNDRLLFSNQDWDLFLEQEKKLQSHDATRLDKLARVGLSLHLLSGLIGGQYQVSSADRELIVIDQGTDKEIKIPMEQAASGQGEITGMWPGLIQSMLSRHAAFFCIEEPETHLYPSAQQQVVNALALTLNAAPGNQMLINTHSPYVLTAFDNLITAAETAKERPEDADRVRKVVPEEMWIAYDRVSAIYLQDGEAITGDEDSEPGTILDHERRSLSGSQFDRSGDGTEKIFGQLLEIRYPIEENA